MAIIFAIKKLFTFNVLALKIIRIAFGFIETKLTLALPGMEFRSVLPRSWVLDALP